MFKTGIRLLTTTTATPSNSDWHWYVYICWVSHAHTVSWQLITRFCPFEQSANTTYGEAVHLGEARKECTVQLTLRFISENPPALIFIHPQRSTALAVAQNDVLKACCPMSINLWYNIEFHQEWWIIQTVWSTFHLINISWDFNEFSWGAGLNM